MSSNQEFNVFNQDLQLFLVPSYGDGACFYHSILQSIDIYLPAPFPNLPLSSFNKEFRSSCIDYRDANNNGKIAMVTEFRRILALSYNQEYYNSSMNEPIRSLSIDDPSYNFNTLRVSIAKTCEWFDITFLPYISYKLQINIFFIRDTYMDIYITGLNYNPDLPNIMMFNPDNRHFDCLATRDMIEEDTEYVFTNDEIVDILIYSQNKYLFESSREYISKIDIVQSIIDTFLNN